MTGYDLIGRMRKTRRRYPLNATEQALYNELVAICNEEQWQDSFSCSNDELCAALRVSENTLDKARCVLIQAGLIFYKSGKSKRQFGQYSFSKKLTTAKFEANVYTNPGINSETNPGTNDEANVGANPADYIKTKKETETKQNISFGASAPAVPKGKISLKTEKPKFEAPALEEVKQFFFSTIGNTKNQRYWPEDKCNLEAAKCLDHYTANGWVQGKGKPIKDWKAAARNWIRNALEGVYGNPAQRMPGKDAPPSASSALPEQPRQLDKLAIEINFLFGRFLEGQITVISVEYIHYNYLRQSGLINFNQAQIAGLKQQALQHKPDLANDENLLQKCMKRFGVLEYFKYLKEKGQQEVFANG